MECLRCGKEVQSRRCQHCGYTIKDGDRIAALFELDSPAMNAAVWKQEQEEPQGPQDQQNEPVQNDTEDIPRNPKDAVAYINRGNMYYKIGDYDKAIADYTRAIGCNPKDASM